MKNKRAAITPPLPPSLQKTIKQMKNKEKRFKTCYLISLINYFRLCFAENKKTGITHRAIFKRTG